MLMAISLCFGRDNPFDKLYSLHGDYTLGVATCEPFDLEFCRSLVGSSRLMKLFLTPMVIHCPLLSGLQHSTPYTITFIFARSDLFFTQPIQDIHPLINLLIHAEDLPLKVADSIQIILTPHGLTLFLQCQHLLDEFDVFDGGLWFDNLGDSSKLVHVV
jgi:hypothetical protein